MMVIIGIVVVIGCVIGGYVGMGGKLMVLYQPLELVIIGGSGVGAYVISNPPAVLSHTGAAFGSAFSGEKYKKEHYVELLCMMYATFKLAKSKGMLALEAHIENPSESDLFSNFPLFVGDAEVNTFFCDYMRMMTMGTDNPHQMEDLMNEEIDIVKHEKMHLAHAVQLMGDSFPALGIVAAVLGVIKTMGSINSPPEILGKMIGGALVGTFLGILLCYGFVGPMAVIIKTVYEGEMKYYDCMKSGLLAYMNGYAPAIAVEFARKSLDPHYRPSFTELEEELANVG